MTISIEASALAGALKGAAGIVEARNTIPILAMVRIVAKKGKSITITTSNTDIEYHQSVAADAKDAFSACVDAKRLLQMAQAAKPGALMTLDMDNDAVVVKSGRSRWRMPCLPTDDFPAMPTGKLSNTMTVDADTLSSAITRTLWAASTEETRFYLNGFFMHGDGMEGVTGKMRMAATDGTSLALMELAQDWPNDAPSVIVPTKLAVAFKDACGEVESVAIKWDATKMTAKFGNIVITGKMIDGGFPDYQRIFPQPCEPVAFDSDEMRGAIKRVRLASDAQTRKVRIKRGEGIMHVSIEGTSGFEGVDDVTCDCADGFETSVNADYLVALLGAAGDGSVTLEQDGPEGVMHFNLATQDGFSALLMPMRI